MKTLKVYFNDSVFTFPNINAELLFTLADSKYIEISKRDKITGEESLYAGFHQWDYFIIDEEI